MGGSASADTRPTLQGLQDQLNNTYTRQQVDNLLRKADPSCFDNGNRYVDCNNGTVTDTVTGLIWLKQADCLGAADYAAANTLAAALQHGQCGLTDHSRPGEWHLPTEDDWRNTLFPEQDCRSPSLTNTPGTGCFADGPQPFTGVQVDVYWSSSGNLEVPNSAWSNDLHYGEEVSLFLTGQSSVVSEDKTQVHHTWPVRGVASAQWVYESYTIRSQVGEGIIQASSAKVSVSEYFFATGMVPANNGEAGVSSISGMYVTEVNVVNGRIDITYGNEAHPAITGKVLSLTPYESGGGSVVWRCGNAFAPGGQLLGTGSGGPVAVYLPTAIANNYLPLSCRRE